MCLFDFLIDYFGFDKYLLDSYSSLFSNQRHNLVLDWLSNFLIDCKTMVDFIRSNCSIQFIEEEPFENLFLIVELLEFILKTAFMANLLTLMEPSFLFYRGLKLD